MDAWSGDAFAVPYLETASETDSIDQVDDSSDDEEFHGFSAEEGTGWECNQKLNLI